MDEKLFAPVVQNQQNLRVFYLLLDLVRISSITYIKYHNNLISHIHAVPNRLGCICIFL